mgnify:CR=1 FL=1
MGYIDMITKAIFVTLLVGLVWLVVIIIKANKQKRYSLEY